MVEERRVGCARVFVKRWRKYGHLEVDLIDCRSRGLEPLDLARDVARLLQV